MTEFETFLLMQYIDSKYVHMQMCNWSLSSGVVRVGSMGSTEPRDFHKLSIYPLFRTSTLEFLINVLDGIRVLEGQKGKI